jgi:Holliday junction resolvasome RuvABC DNA-binding subunit
VGLGRKQQTGQNRHRFYVQVRRELGSNIFGFVTKNPKIMFGFVTNI